MQAVAIFPTRRAVQLVEIPRPVIQQPDQVLLRMREVGICGTDREIVTFAYGTPPPGTDFLVIGHEAVAEVVATGSVVTRVRPGDIVVPTVRRPCASPTCRPCRDGRQDFCVTGQYRERGIKELHGFMTEYIVEQERYLHQVPPTLSDLAVLVEPLTIAEKALAQVWTIQSRLPWGVLDAPAAQRGRGLNALVLGAGPVGLLGAMLLVAQGFTTYVYARSAAPNPRAQIAADIGATYLSAATMPNIAAIPAQIGTLDLVYEAVGSSALAFTAMQALGPNGIFIFTGVPELGERKMGDVDRLMRQLVLNNQVGFGSVNASAMAYTAAIADLGLFAQRWTTPLYALITDHFAPIEAPMVLEKHLPGIKQVIAFTHIAERTA